MATGLVWHERMMWHETPPAAGVIPARGIVQPDVHAENAETKRRMKNMLDGYGITPLLEALEPHAVEDDVLLRFHTSAHLTRVRALSDGMGGDSGDFAPVGPGSDAIARLAVGSTIAAVYAVLSGRVRNAYALVRPPGHHAERDRGRGFCVFGNVAVAILDALARRQVERVAVVDWDVHHGNGTEQAFYENPDVLTISMHQDKLYPVDTGAFEDRGAGAGRGCNINVPLPPGSGGGAYYAAMERIVLPAVRAHRPDLIVVCCGFDAATFDPLGNMMLLSNHYRVMTEWLMAVADDLCGGRLVMSHEGGYSASYVPFCGAAVMEGLLGVDSMVRDAYAQDELTNWQALQPHQEKRIDEMVEAL